MANKDEIKELVQSIVKETVSDEMAPLKEQATKWGDLINGQDRSVSHTPAEKGIAAARAVRAITASGGDSAKAAHFAKKAWNDDLGKSIQDTFTKAADASDFDTSGFMLQEDMMSEIIELLRPRSVMRAIGTPTVGMPRGTLTMPKQTGDVSAAYVGESQDITKSEPSGGQITLSAKKLAALVPISNDLLMYSAGDQADRFVRDTMLRQIATREDKAFLRDDGTQNTPKGLRHWINSNSVVAQSGTGTADMESDLIGLMQKLESNNVNMDNPVWIMSPRTKNALMVARNTNGDLAFPELRAANPSIYTIPIVTTTNVPNNLGSGTDESEVYLVNANDCLIGEAGGLEVSTDPGASYIEGGSLVSAFSRDQVVIRTILRHDFAMIYDVAGAVLTEVTWS